MDEKLVMPPSDQSCLSSRSQRITADVTELDENLRCSGKILLADEEVEVAGLSQSRIAVGYDSEDGTLVRQRGDALGAERVKNSQKLADQPERVGGFCREGVM